MANVRVEGCDSECEADVAVWKELRGGRSVAGTKFICPDCRRECAVTKEVGPNANFIVTVAESFAVRVLEGLLGLNGR